MAKPRKFRPGDRVWRYDENRRVYLNGSSSPDVESSYVEYEVTGVSGRSYHIAAVFHGQPKGRHLGSVATLGFDKADRLYLSAAEKDDEVFVKTHSVRLADAVRASGADTLRRVKAVLDGSERTEP